MNTRKLCHVRRSPVSRKRGSVLLVVLVLVMLLTLGVYAFTERMLAEHRAAIYHGQALQARTAADSGVEVLLASLDARRRRETSDAPTQPLQGIALNDVDDTLRFSVVCPSNCDDNLRYGPADESAKLNLNSLLRQSELEQTYFAEGLSYEQRDYAAELRSRLLSIPKITPETADAILDWLDTDHEPRLYGAEVPDDAGRARSAEVRNGSMKNLDELLLVRGVTADLFYGEDANRNGLLEQNEDDGATSPPIDDADASLDLGWIEYLTVCSEEAPLRRDGTPKIHLNQDELFQLYDELEAEFDSEKARFVTAFRLVGPVNEDELLTSSSSTSEAGPGSSTTTGNESDRSGDPMRRGGLSLVTGGQYIIFSIYELIDSRVEVQVDGQMTVLQSPWTSDNLGSEFPKLVDTLTIDRKPLPGRINVNEARLEVLQSVPGLSYSTADRIVQASRDRARQRTECPLTTSWLVSEKIISLQEMRRLDRYLTGSGAVYSAQVLGHFDQAGPFCRLGVMIDARRSPARLISFCDLSNLGRGYPKQLLQPLPFGSSGRL